MVTSGPPALLGWVDAVHMADAAASGGLVAGRQGTLPPSL